MNTRKPIVLVLCTGNSCRSQMAEGFLKKSHGDHYDFQSAGMSPAEEVHPLAVTVMGEVGIDISNHHPKSTREFLGKQPVRHIIIVCDKAGQTCPRIWPGVISRTSIPFDDPATFEGTEEAILSAFRRVRDEIETAMRAWKPQFETAARSAD